MKTKVCSRCKKRKTKTFFYKNKANKDGLQHHCKKCDLKQNSELYTNSESYRASRAASAKRWQAKNKEHLRAYSREKYRMKKSASGETVRAWKRSLP